MMGPRQSVQDLQQVCAASWALHVLLVYLFITC